MYRSLTHTVWLSGLLLTTPQFGLTAFFHAELTLFLSLLSLSLFSHHIILLSIRRFLRYDDILGVHNSPGDSARQTDSHIARW
jgi:hypothetical protein